MRERARAIYKKAYREADRMKEIPVLIAEELERITFYTFDEILEELTLYNPDDDQDEYMVDIIEYALEGDL